MGTMLTNNNRIAILAIMFVSLMSCSSVLASNWWESTKVKGDFRYRHEMIDKQDSDTRHRHRIRARFGLYGDVSPYSSFGIRLATGSDDPVSTNQTLDGAFSTKTIGLDLAYMKLNHVLFVAEM